MKNNCYFYIKLVSECIFTLFIVTILSFLLMRISSIDTATAYGKRNSALVTDQQIEVIRKQLGIDLQTEGKDIMSWWKERIEGKYDFTSASMFFDASKIKIK